MTSVEKLHISGIRSFNPNPAARQTIEFHKPLTIILGKNGAGKTTIIEALLNATTGEMPPGAAAGEKCAFVYDPKALNGESEVKAQIRLVFKAKGDKVMQVVRSFQATRSKGKVRFETLDAVLACKDDSSGQVQAMTYRSTDVDRMVPDLLGVPKAVLEHVIFCHQEDCNWPLGPPGEVKKRFDDIFASTRYVAALDKLRDVAKEYKDRQKDNESVLIALREHKETAKQLQTEADEKQEQVRIIETRSKEIEPRLKQLVAAVNAIDAESHRIETMSQEISVVRGRIAEKERALRVLQQQRVAMGHAAAPQNTLEELVTLQRDFGSTMQRVQADLAHAQSKLLAAEASRRSASNACGEARGALTALEHEASQHRQRVVELHRVISSMTTDFVAGEAEIDGAALDRVMDTLATRFADARAALDALVESHTQTIAKLNASRDEQLRFIDADGKERDMKEAQISALMLRIAAAQRDRPHTASIAELNSLQAEVNALTEAATREAQARRDGKATHAVQDLIAKVQACQTEAQALSEDISRSNQDSETSVRMGFLRTTIAEREAQCHTALADVVGPALRGAGATLPNGALTLAAATDAAAAVKQRKLRALAQAEEDTRQAERDTSALQQSLQHSRARMESVQRELMQKRAVVTAVIGKESTDAISAAAALPKLLDEASDRHYRATRKLTSLQSMAKCYDSFIASARSDHTCVVCRRDLDNDGVANFVRINEERQRTTPAQIEAAKKEMDDALAQAEKLRKAIPIAESLTAGLAELEELKISVARLDEELQNKNALLADITTKRRELQRQLDAVDGIVAHLSRLEETTTATQKIKHELSALEAKCATIGGGGAGAPRLPRDQLQRLYDAKAAELRSLNDQLLEAQRLVAQEAGAEGTSAGAQLLAKRTQLSELQVAAKRADDVDQHIASMKSEAEGHKGRLSAIANRKLELQRNLDAIASRLEEAEAGHRTALQAAQAKVAAADKNVQTLNASSRAVIDYLSKNRKQDALDAARSHLRAQEASLKQLDDEVKALSESIAKMRNTVDEQHNQQQLLADGVRILEIQREIDRDNGAIKKAEASLITLRDEKLRDVAPIIGSVDPDPNDSAMSLITRARDRCRAKATELEKTRAQNTGSLETLVAAIAEKKAALSRDKYKDIDNRYAATFIKVQTTEHAISDIEKYYRALERAVSSYHAEKVAQINKIVSDLWRSTYRGSDIDSIEIKSEDDTTGSMARRSYKYRVVMKRGDTELDMRGRCSAGQKVLASVIIRMALSEAFCCDCGILALDEPTTNLDDDNSKALAESLRELISARRYVSHFQLIVITHDEEFVRTLGAGHRADSFYYVQKDRDGTYSTISERRFGELFA